MSLYIGKFFSISLFSFAACLFDPSNSIFFPALEGNLPSDMRTHELEEIFRKYGKINYCESKTGRGLSHFADCFFISFSFCSPVTKSILKERK
jgi:hypothetical protein